MYSDELDPACERTTQPPEILILALGQTCEIYPHNLSPSPNHWSLPNRTSHPGNVAFPSVGLDPTDGGGADVVVVRNGENPNTKCDLVGRTVVVLSYLGVVPDSVRDRATAGAQET